jgi:ribosome-binding ATPase
LSHIREVDAIAHVIRCFDSDKVSNVNESVDPVRDVEIIETELILKDIENLEKFITRTQKVAKREAALMEKVELCLQMKDHLFLGKMASQFEIKKRIFHDYVKEMELLTSKPMIYVANISENPEENKNYPQALQALVDEKKSKMIPISAEIESQISELDDEDEKKEFLESVGLQESGLNNLVRSIYESLGLITYFTQGETEVRSWTVEKETTASKAAGIIHSDFEKNFIKAEVIKFADFEKYKSEEEIKKLKKLKIEGKDYIVQDGDIMMFRVKK